MHHSDQVHHRLADIEVFVINALPAAQTVCAGIDRICHDQALKAEAARRYYAQVAADLLFFFGDIAIQAEAMGARVHFAPDEMPAVKAPATLIQAPRASQAPRMALNGRVVREMRAAFPRRAIAAQVYGPFTVAGQLAGEQTLLRQVREAPDDLEHLLCQTTAVAEDYAGLLLSAGADVLWISDPLAALLPPGDFEAFAGRYLRRILDMMPNRRSILHICGDVSDRIEPMLATGAGGISFDQCMALPAVEDRIPREVAFIGNLEPVEVLAMAEPEAVAVATRELIEAMAIRRHFVLSTGCAPPPTTPLENVKRFIDTGREHLALLRPHAALLAALADAVAAGDEEAAVAGVVRGQQLHLAPDLLLSSGLVRAVRQASMRYEAKTCYLPEILLTVNAFYRAMAQLKTGVSQPKRSGARVVLGTVRGDLHAIGKDLVRIMLEANGFEVLDLGVDVAPQAFIAAVQRFRPSIVGLSAFVTSARRQLPGLIETIRGSGGPELKVIVGGAAVNAAIAAEVGADGYAREAVAAVKLARKISAGKESAVHAVYN